MNPRGLLLAVAVVVLAGAGCPPKKIVDPPPPDFTCEASAECPTGHICLAGNCVIGTCDPIIETDCDSGTVAEDSKAFCCKPWELCNGVDFQCKNDPNVHGIGCDQNDPSCTPCEDQSDCGAGQFCSGAACFNAAGREDCTSSFQCSTGERCDKNVFLCVPDRGGCTFCDAFPELCCEEGQTCSQESGFCIEIPDAECENPGTQDSCPNGTFCDDLKRCVQCDSDDDCGPGLACDEGSGSCFSVADQCTTDADCNGNKKCAVDTQQCVIPQCTSDSTCVAEDSRTRCDLHRFECFLPPAVCEETDEPNDSASEATPMTDGISYSGVLCRGNIDVLSFPVIADKRYTATVDFHGSGQPGISVQMLDTNLAIESFTTFSSTQASVQLAGVTGDAETGNYFLRVEGDNEARDSWSYTVTIRVDEPSQPADCTPAGQPEEPNDDFDHATPLALGQTKTFSRCGTADSDFYSIPLSPLHSLQIVVGGFFNAEGNLNIDVFSANNVASRLSGIGGQTVNDVEQVAAPEGPASYFMKVSLSTPNGAVQNQTYNITATELARPASCLPDPTEGTSGDGTTITAATLTLVPDQVDPVHNLGSYLADGVAPDGTDSGSAVGPIRCNPQDVDVFHFTMPANLGGVVQLRFNHNEGDMALDLLDASGTQIATSNVSNANTDIDEQVTVPGSTSDVEYFARARLAASTGGTQGQHYSVEIHTFDNAQCIASEPNGGDDTFATGRCIGDAADYTGSGFPCASFVAEPLGPVDCTTAAPGTAGCGRTCGNSDSDFYRIGIVKNDQTFHARLTFDKTQGALDLVRDAVTVGSTGAPTETTVSDTDADGIIDFSFVDTTANGKDYAVRVKPKGNTGHQLQPYSLVVEVGAECDDDEFDGGSAANEKPSTATFIDTFPRTLAESRCDNDVDVYQVILLQGETLRVQLDQADTTPGGLEAEVFPRSAITDLTVVPTPANAAAIAIAGGGASTFQAAARQDVYVVVRPGTGFKVTGPYTLQLALQ